MNLRVANRQEIEAMMLSTQLAYRAASDEEIKRLDKRIQELREAIGVVIGGMRRGLPVAPGIGVLEQALRDDEKAATDSHR